MTTDPGLASLRDLYELVRGIRDIPAEQVKFLTVPRRPYAADPNRDELVQPDADRLFEQLRTDRPLTVTPPTAETERLRETARAAEPEASAPPSGTGSAPAPVPTFTGTTAGTADCR